MTGCDLIPPPEGSHFDLFCKMHDYSPPPCCLSKDTLDVCVFYLRLCALNAANEDESVATAARATG